MGTKIPGPNMPGRVIRMKREKWPILCGLYNNLSVGVTNYATEAEWLAARSKLITASIIPIIMGLSSFMGRLQLWYVMQGMIDQTSSRYVDERAMGQDSESFHAQLHEQITGRTVEDPGDYCICTNDKYPGIGATLDRLQHDEEKGLGVLELKWHREFMRKDWDPLPESVLYQVQTQMLVTELPWASVSVVLGGCKPICTDIEAHKGVQAGIVRAVAAWMRSLAAGVPPEPTGHETDAPTLDAIFGDQDDGECDAGLDLLPHYEEWDRIAAERIAISKREDEIKAKVKAYMGSYTKALGPGYEFNITGKNRVLRRKGREQ